MNILAFHRSQRTGISIACLLLVIGISIVALPREPAYGAAPIGQTFSRVVSGVQPRIVKLYGAGGVRGLEAYQTGFLVSADGHVLTALSYVLDTDLVVAVLNDGRRFDTELLGVDPRLEIAVLKIDATDLSYFDLSAAVEASPGARVLAFSNLFNVATGNEPASVLHGCVSAKSNLSARRGAFTTPYKGPAYILDALTNNPGAAGGALTDRSGQLLGLLGKELRNSLDNTWLNYAIPISELAPAVDDILAGKVRPRTSDEVARKPAEPITLNLLGVVLVPDVLAKTPPFVDQVQPDSPAAEADLRMDDLVLFVNERLVRSVKELVDELTFIDRIDEVRLTVIREKELVELSLFAEE